MGIKTLFIAPYRGLKELATVLAKQQMDLEILVEEADLGDAIPVVKENEHKGIQFIISRGGTAKLISQFTNVPVVEIKLSGYDILRTLTLIKDYQMKVQMIGFPNICNDVLSVSNLLNIDISYTIVHRKEEVEHAVREALMNGAQLILGDTVAVSTAERFGLQGMMITTGKEAVLEVFDQVRQMNKVMEQLKNDFSLYKDLLNVMNDGIVIFQESGKIEYTNQIFVQKLSKNNLIINQESIFNLPEEFLPILSELLQNKNTSSNFMKDILWDGQRLSVTGGRLNHEHGDYFYIKINENHVESQKSIQIKKERVTKTSLAQFVTNSRIMKTVLAQARAAADSRDALIIWGEKGVGKKLLASSIHSESEWKDGQFVELTIVKDSTDVIKEISFYLSTLGQTTLYLTGFEKLSMEHQRECLELLIKNEQIRVILSFPFDPNENPNRMVNVYSKEFKCLGIYMPTLRERIDDLGELIRLYISMFNAQFGKQVVGIKTDALSYLSDLPWKENVEQLKDMVKDLVNASEGDFIDKLAIDRLSHKSLPEEMESEIDLNKTLAEIEREIILKVLKEENMNQTKAAKRLGINRTTLWRKIN